MTKPPRKRATTEAWRNRIVIDPAICQGKPFIRGTQIMVSTVLDYLNASESPSEVISQYPSLKAADLQAAIAYAASLAKE